MNKELRWRWLAFAVGTGSLILVACASEGRSTPGTVLMEPSSTATAGPDTVGTNTGGSGANGDAPGSSASTGGPGAQTDGGAGSEPIDPPALVAGCEGQRLRAGIPANLGARGPWPVGALTTVLGGVVTEIWYPGQIGSGPHHDNVIYPLEEHLPETEQGKIKPEGRRPFQVCDCFRDLALDGEAGPFPVLVFVHGTAGFRTTNLGNVTHWASRGFVVVAADHPGIQLKSMLDGIGGLAGTFRADQAGDVRKMLMNLVEPPSDVAFLKGHLDLTRIGLLGHSAGANAVTRLGDVADVIIAHAGGAALTAERAKSAMFVSGDKDAVVAPSMDGYDGTPKKPKRSVWLKDGGHLVGGSLCGIRDPTDATKDIVTLANEFRIGNDLVRPAFGRLFDGCNATPDALDGDFMPASRGVAILSYISAGQFEETLHCASTASAELARTQQVFGADVSQFIAEVP